MMSVFWRGLVERLKSPFVPGRKVLVDYFLSEDFKLEDASAVAVCGAFRFAETLSQSTHSHGSKSVLARGNGLIKKFY